MLNKDSNKSLGTRKSPFQDREPWKGNPGRASFAGSTEGNPSLEKLIKAGMGYPRTFL